jgi:hypothetical protein
VHCVRVNHRVLPLGIGSIFEVLDPVVHLFPLSEINRRQVVLNDVVLPVVYLPVPDILFRLVVCIVDCEPCLALDVSEFDLVELLSKRFLSNA